MYFEAHLQCKRTIICLMFQNILQIWKYTWRQKIKLKPACFHCAFANMSLPAIICTCLFFIFKWTNKSFDHKINKSIEHLYRIRFSFVFRHFRSLVFEVLVNTAVIHMQGCCKLPCDFRAFLACWQMLIKISLFPWSGNPR